MKIRTKFVFFLVFACLLFWMPLLITTIWSKSMIFEAIEKLPKADAALIFGANLTDGGEITEILSERLEAGRMLYEKGTVKLLTTSNTSAAAEKMQEFLTDHGVPRNVIDVDVLGDKTPDTCRNEKNAHPEGRKLIFLSQRFHLPRILFQCTRLGVNGIALAIDDLTQNDRTPLPASKTFAIRFGRAFREALLLWLAVLNIYR